MRVKFNFVFDRKKKAVKPGQPGLIELRAYYRAKTKYFSTKIEVRPEDWNSSKERVGSKHKESRDLNDQLDRIMYKLGLARTQHEINDRPFDLETVRSVFRDHRERPASFFEFVLSEVQNNEFYKPGTKVQHRGTISLLKKFNNGKDLSFSEINFNLIDRYMHFLKGQGLAQNTIRKHHKNIKAQIEMAIKRGYYEHKNPCKEIRIKEVEVQGEVLTWSQLQVLEEFQFEEYEIKLEQIRDMFLFACYTGLRISDVINLRTDYVRQTDKGPELDFYTVKVNKRAKLPLIELFPIKNTNTSRPIRILEKYYQPGSEFLFRRYTDQYINRQLKEIAVLAKLQVRKMCFKVARETFATYLANKVPMTTLKRLLQHSNIKTTERYIRLNEQMMRDNLMRCNSRDLT